MSGILGPDGLPVTREKGAFGPGSLTEFPQYTDEHWSGLRHAAVQLFEERYTTLLSTPMALLRADFIGLAVNVDRLLAENKRLRDGLQAVVDADDATAAHDAAVAALVPSEAGPAAVE